MKRHSRGNKSMILLGQEKKKPLKKNEGFHKVGVSFDDKDSSPSLFESSRFRTLKTRQSYMVNCFSQLPPIKRATKSSLNCSKQDFDELIAEIDKVDCKPLREKLENSGKRYHSKIQNLLLRSGAVAAERRALKMVAWRSKAFSKVELVPSKKEVRGMIHQWKKEIKALSLAY
mmetsp:Transcript_4940/g.9262  ORF Transcript_4940/g.9262 Transcript_4940/m.9262 type:complete len:173 (+) Transcript_4940:17-535(+)